jgi:hypothetical protein
MNQRINTKKLAKISKLTNDDFKHHLAVSRVINEQFTDLLKAIKLLFLKNG